MVVDEVRRFMEAAIGRLTPRKARELASSLMRGEGKDQVSRAAQDLMDWSNRNRERLTDLVRSEVRSQLKQVGLASRDEVDALRKRVRQLEKAKGVPRKGAAKRSTAKRSPGRRSPEPPSRQSSAPTSAS